MQIRDAEIIRLIERIGEHYQSNISNRFIRPLLLQLPMDKQTLDMIEILTEKSSHFVYQGFHLDDLYHQIMATARFIALARRELVPGLRNRLSNASTSSADRVIRDMAVNNFGSNLQLFSDLINELYVKLVEIDKREAKGKMPLYTQISELRDIGRLLIGG